jgi:flagellar hook assembly protein FlgD
MNWVLPALPAACWLSQDALDSYFGLGGSATADVQVKWTAETQIRFRLPADAPTTLTVYDFSGRMVRTVTEGMRPAGTSIITWDGRDTAGDRVASGVYLYEVRTATETARGKLVRLR